MKKFFAAFAILWYLVALTGLDIHSDLEHGRIYVVPGLLAQSCEMIHPHSHCHDSEACGCGCCHHSGCDEDEDCCTDDFESVTVTATDPETQSVQQIQPVQSVAVFFDTDAKSEHPGPYAKVRSEGPPPKSSDTTVLFCVMRA